MKLVKYISLFLFALLGLFNQVEAKVIPLENQEIEIFSGQNFEEQTQEIQWLGLLHLQKEALHKNQILSFNFSIRSFNQNFSEELCIKGNSESSKLGFQLGKKSTSCQEYSGWNEIVFNDDKELVDSWKVLDDAGYAALKKNPASLEKLSSLLKNAKLADAGLDESMVSRLIKGNKNAGGSAAALDDLTKGLDDLVASGTKFEDIGKLVVDLEKGGNFAEGAGWIQRHITSNVDDFAGKTLIFESVEKAGETIRRVDVKMPDGNITKYFEFKTVSEIPPSNFATQFVKDMQIADVSYLGQLKWVFDGKKVSSLEYNVDDFIDALDKVDIPQLVIDKLVPGANKTKDALLEVIESRFDEIFQEK